MTKKSKMIALVLVTAGAVLFSVDGCQRTRSDAEDTGGGGTFYQSQDESWGGGGSSYTHFSSHSYARGGFGGHGGGGS